MPKNKINYENTIIYKIVCNDLSINEIYVGHTTDFSKRKSHHKSVCNNEKSIKYNYKIYQIIRANGGWNNWSMLQIEIYSCKNNREAESRERYWIEKLNAKLNMYIPTRTHKEYYENNKDEILQNKKKYYENNKDEILQNNKIYYKKYYENNKEKLNEQLPCIFCGCNYTKNHKNRHEKTIKHKNNINSNLSSESN